MSFSLFPCLLDGAKFASKTLKEARFPRSQSLVKLCFYRRFIVVCMGFCSITTSPQRLGIVVLIPKKGKK